MIKELKGRRGPFYSQHSQQEGGGAAFATRAHWIQVLCMYIRRLPEVHVEDEADGLQYPDNQHLQRVHLVHRYTVYSYAL